MKIRLPDGSLLDTGDGTPSTRQNKNKSGRAARKAYRGRNWSASVGGFNNDMTAIHADRFEEMCVVVPDWKGRKADGSVNSPWLHADATPTIRSSVGLRLHFMPYLYTLMWLATTTHAISSLD